MSAGDAQAATDPAASEPGLIGGIEPGDDLPEATPGLVIPDDLPNLTDKPDPVVVTVEMPGDVAVELMARANQPPPAAIPFPSALQLFVPGAGMAVYMIRKVSRRGSWRK